MSKALLLVLLLSQDSARPRKAFVDLTAEGTLAIAGESVAWKDLSASLKRLAGSGIRELALRADGTVPFSSVQSVMAAAKEAGIEGVQFSTDKPMPPVKFATEARRSVRIKLREGAKGLEIVILQESPVASIDDLKKQLKALEKGPIVVDADFEVPYGAVREVVAALTDQGFDKVSFAGTARKESAIRVLYAERAPRWEFRYLRNMLERTPDVKLDVFLATADRDFPGVLPEFPADLSAYDVVLMGGLAELDADRRKALAGFVEHGGGVVWMAPEEQWLDLASICPVTLKRESDAALTLDAKEGAPALKWAEMSDKAHAGWTATPDADARVLVSSNRGAFLAVQAVGKGRALYVGATDTWRWREGTGDKPHFSAFWLAVLKNAANR
jgi:biopolymer transport protein ExbD